MEKSNLDSLKNLMVRRGVIIPSYQAYGELSGFYDYGPVGLNIKKRIERLWREHFINRLNNLEIEGAIIGPQAIFEASGHLGNFTDPISTCQKCGHSHRADKLLEEFFSKKGDCASMDRVSRMSVEEMEAAIKSNNVRCESCGLPLQKVDTFNLMLGTRIGPLNSVQGYLRPETAQGIFLNFKNVFRSYGLKLPVGIGQIGKAFRNEISPRNLLLRMREFSQMELEYFFDPGEGGLKINNKAVGEGEVSGKINFLTRDEQLGNADFEFREREMRDLLKEGNVPNSLFAYLLLREAEFLLALGFKSGDFRFRQMLTEELPHYSKGNVDLEVRIGDKFEEVAGNAYRTDFDLRNHQAATKTDMSVLSGEKKVLPHVVELSFGLDRLFYGLLYSSLYKDEARGWEVMMLSGSVSPYDFALFPLQKDEPLVSEAVAIFDSLTAKGYSVYYSASGSIGKRYARADEIGITKAITVDFETLSDRKVTVREITDAKQVRLGISELAG